jgi:sugar/nucleoside kinase (ribokinase family)
MKTYDIVGIGNAIVDLLVRVPEETFAALGLNKGSMNLVDEQQQRVLLEQLDDNDITLVSGGSLANSIIASAQLGSKNAFVTSLADDRYGLHYLDEAQALSVDMPCAPHVGKTTGTSAILVTPDAERTMQTCLGAAELLGAEHVSSEVIQSAGLVFIEGYLLTNASGQGAASRAVGLAKAANVPVAFTTSAVFVLEYFRQAVDEVIAACAEIPGSLIFANQEEARVLLDGLSPKAAAIELGTKVGHAVVTAGAEGVYICKDGITSHVPAHECTPVDLTGAGDMFAGAYLHGLHRGLTPEVAAKKACGLAAMVIQQVGARLPSASFSQWKSL